MSEPGNPGGSSGLAGGRREWARRAIDAHPSVGFFVSGALALFAYCVLTGPTAVLHPGRVAIGFNPSSDFQIMTWSLAWWPWAIRHGVDPLHTPLLWAPNGFSTLWMTTIPAPALLAFPLTLVAGPLVTYNALMLLAPALAAGAAYLLCRELTGRFFPSLVGGLLFGLSPYMLGHTLSQHLDLTFVFPLPLLALLLVRLVRRETSGPRFVAGFAVLLLLQLGSSLELFLDFSLLLGIGMALALAGGTWPRRLLLRAYGLVALAFVVCSPVLVTIAIVALTGQHAPLTHAPSSFAIDLANAIVPTQTLLVGSFRSAGNVAQHFVGNIGERDGYLGIPLLLVAALAIRAEWRRGAWLLGALLVIALVLSFGPILTLAGRPLAQLGFSYSRLPLLRDALPARLSLFTALAASCLAALGLARLRRPMVTAALGCGLVLSLLPNFSPPGVLTGAWSVSRTFRWATPRTANAFIQTAAWAKIARSGSNILVLPTGDRTRASYWQAKAGLRFRLAVPVTPFAPPAVETAPIVQGLLTDDLPRNDGVKLAAARLRAFLLSRDVRYVVVTWLARQRWWRIVARATGGQALALRGADIYRVSPRLPLLRATGDVAVAHAPLARAALASLRGGRQLVKAWLSFDGHRALVRARTQVPGGGASKAALLSKEGDGGATAAAVDAQGRAAVAFTESRNGEVLLRAATRVNRRWRISTLDRTSQPIWSPHVAIANGVTLAAWIDETDPTRSVRVAVREPGGGWRHPLTLENSDGISAVQLGAGAGGIGVLAWSDMIAGQSRVRAATFRDGVWSPITTVVTALAPQALFRVTLSRPDASVLTWKLYDPGTNRAVGFRSRWIEGRWTRGRRAAR